MLCNHALRSYSQYSLHASPDGSPSSRQRGMLVPYESLPGIIPRLLLPLFNVSAVSDEWLRSMAEEASYYSKGRKNVRIFTGDSEDKDSRASPEIRYFAKAILAPTYSRLARASAEALQRMAPEIYATLPAINASVAAVAVSGVDFASVSLKDWSYFSAVPVPNKSSARVARRLGAGSQAQARPQVINATRPRGPAAEINTSSVSRAAIEYIEGRGDRRPLSSPHRVLLQQQWGAVAAGGSSSSRIGRSGAVDGSEAASTSAGKSGPPQRRKMRPGLSEKGRPKPKPVPHPPTVAYKSSEPFANSHSSLPFHVSRTGH